MGQRQHDFMPNGWIWRPRHHDEKIDEGEAREERVKNKEGNASITEQEQDPKDK